MVRPSIKDNEAKQSFEPDGEGGISPLPRQGSSRYLSLVESIAFICTFGRNNVSDQDDENRQAQSSGSNLVEATGTGRRQGTMFRGGQGWASWRRRSKTALLSAAGQADPAFFLHLLRTEFPEVWGGILVGDVDTVVCVPQSTSLSQEDLTIAEARAHVLTPSNVPGEFETLDGWRVFIIGNEVVTGAGFPERRRVRLLLSEDLSHYLSAAGQQPLAASSAPLSPSPGAGMIDEAKSGADQTTPSPRGGIGESKSADMRRKSCGNGSGNSSGEKGASTLKEVKVNTLASAKTASMAGEAEEARGKEERRDRESRRTSVRLLHVSRPLIGGLRGVPESAGELDAATVGKYAAVFKSYPEMEGVFYEMDSFADAVVLYCQKHLASRDTVQPGAHGAEQFEGGAEGGMGGGGGVESSQERPPEEKLCALVAEQWRRSAAALARSRCVKGGGGAGATEQREVMMLQVTESYLMDRLSRGLGVWLAGFHLRAEGDLRRAIHLLRHHTQEDIGVSPPFQCDLSSAVDCLAKLSRCLTPMEKMLQIKKCLRLIQTSVDRHMEAYARGDFDDEEGSLDGSSKSSGTSSSLSGRNVLRPGGGARAGGGKESRRRRGSIQMATDDLVLLLVCCVLEIGRRSTSVLDVNDDGRMLSFFVEMAFIKAFHFCEDSTSAVYFAVSTFAVALEWLLAKVGSRLAEIPAQNGLGVFLTIEDRPPRRPPTALGDLDGDAHGVAGDNWGADALSSVPPALCDVALRENIAAELDRKWWEKETGDVLRVEDLDDPAEALPWEKMKEQEAPQMTEEEKKGKAGEREATAELTTKGAQTGSAGRNRTSGGIDDSENEVDELQSTASRKSVPSTSALLAQEPCDRVMVFGDSGERGSEQTTMFEVFEGQRETVTHGGRGSGRGRNEADVVQVSCSQQCFAAVTRGGGLHTWGLDDSSGRLGHGRRPENEDLDGDQEDTDATVEARGVRTGAATAAGPTAAAADQQFQLRTPSRVMSLFKDRVIQVSCGARHTLAVTADGQLFAWGDNRHGQCGLPWWWSQSLTWPNDNRGSLSCRIGGGFGKKLAKKPAGNKPFRFCSNKRTLSCRDLPSTGGAGVFEGCGVEAAGKGRGGEGGGWGSRVVLLQPTLVFLWQTSAGLPAGTAGDWGIPGERYGLPLRVLQVACGRHHSLALARPRQGGSLHGGSVTWSSTPLANTGTNLDANLLLSWGRSGSGRLGRSPPRVLPRPRRRPISRLPLSPLRRKGPLIRSSIADHDAQGASYSRVPSEEVDVSAGYSPSENHGGNQNPAGVRSSSSSSPPPQPLAPLSEAAGSFYNLPAIVECDWSYRVNDHRKQSAPLVSATENLRAMRSGENDPGPVAIAAGWRHSVAITADGATFVWGCGAGGRLGLGSRADVHTPRQVRALASRSIRIRQAAAGRAHTLFLSESGIVYSCGSNEVRQQGRSFVSESSAGGTFRSASPSATEPFEGAAGAGDSSNTMTGGGRGGGEDSSSSSGRGRRNILTEFLAPTVVGFDGEGTLAGLCVESIAAGDDHSTAVTAPKPVSEEARTGGGSGGKRGGATDDTVLRRVVFTWGLNVAGQCVQSRASEVVSTPQEAALLSGARTVGCGAGHTMVVL